MTDTTEGPDLEAKSFTLADLQWARREGFKHGVESALGLADAGATSDYIRTHLLTAGPYE